MAEEQRQPRKRGPKPRPPPGPRVPPDTPGDGIVDEEWADKHGHDRASVEANQAIRNYERARARGEQVNLELDDPIIKFEYWRNRLRETMCSVVLSRLDPEPSDGCLSVKLGALRGWGDLVDRIRPLLRGGGTNVWRWSIMRLSQGGTYAQATFRITPEDFTEKEVEDVPTKNQPAQPAAQQGGWQWNGYQYVWVTGAQPHQPPPPYQPPPPPYHHHQPQQPQQPPPPPEAGITGQLLHQVNLLSQQISDLRAENAALRAAPPQVQQPQAPAGPPMTALQIALQDPAFAAYYYRQGPGATAAGGPAPAATPAAAPAPPKSPLESIEEGSKYLEKAMEIGKSISKKFAPPEAPAAPKAEPIKAAEDDGLPVAVKMINEVAIPIMRETGEINTAMLMAGNMGFVENKLSKGMDKILEMIDKGKKAKVEAHEAEVRASKEAEEALERQRRANAEAADEERRKSEDHLRNLERIKGEEQLKIAQQIIERAKEAGRAPEPQNLGTIGRKPPEPVVTEVPAESEAPSAETETTTN